MLLILDAKALENGDGILDGRRFDLHALEAAFERGVLLDVFAILVERGRTGKAIYAIKGNMAKFDFRMMWVNSFRYLGDMSEETYGVESGGRRQAFDDNNTGTPSTQQAAE
jgi:hypothetical protein